MCVYVAHPSQDAAAFTSRTAVLSLYMRVVQRLLAMTPSLSADHTDTALDKAVFATGGVKCGRGLLLNNYLTSVASSFHAQIQLLSNNSNALFFHTLSSPASSFAVAGGAEVPSLPSIKHFSFKPSSPVYAALVKNAATQFLQFDARYSYRKQSGPSSSEGENGEEEDDEESYAIRLISFFHLLLLRCKDQRLSMLSTLSFSTPVPSCLLAWMQYRIGTPLAHQPPFQAHTSSSSSS